MKIKHYFLLITLLFVLMACDNTMKDEELPVIDMTGENAFPQNCVTVYRGESFTFNARFTDNIELGSYSIEMHHNFDHHAHSTSSEECEMGVIKQAVKPLLFIDEYTIPNGKTEYSASIEINIPGDADTGDYHFSIRLTDKSGWQTFKGISMKIADRN
jgi:hypothetical protein